MKTYSPLRYPGGKNKLAPFMKSVLENNSLTGGTYIEPYAGGAAIGLSLLAESLVQEVIINDFDICIYAFWHSVAYNTDKFLEVLKETPVTIEEWGRQKEIYRAANTNNLLELGFATFFLNRTNHSGVIKGGVIGGKKQDGQYKLDARFNKNDLMERISFIGRLREKIRVYNMDALALLDELDLPPQSLIYLDPPYYIKGSCLYKNFYSHDDHKAIAEKIKMIETPLILTYDNVEPIRELYNDYDLVDFELRYSANKGRIKGSEILVYKNLEKPRAIA